MKLVAGQSLLRDEIRMIANPSSETVRQLLRAYSQKKRCLDLTRGRSVNSLILTDEDQLVLLPFRIKTLVDRVLEAEAE